MSERQLACVRFCHDLEDGWYRARLSDGTVIERNHWPDLLQELQGHALLWVGPTYYRPENFPLQPNTDPEVEAFIDEVRAELMRARAKFPGNRIMTVALAEEFGELCKAVLDESKANVRKEAVQTAVMAARVVLDGDGSVEEWRREKGLDAL